MKASCSPAQSVVGGPALQASRRTWFWDLWFLSLGNMTCSEPDAEKEAGSCFGATFLGWLVGDFDNIATAARWFAHAPSKHLLCRPESSHCFCLSSADRKTPGARSWCRSACELSGSTRHSETCHSETCHSKTSLRKLSLTSRLLASNPYSHSSLCPTVGDNRASANIGSRPSSITDLSNFSNQHQNPRIKIQLSVWPHQGQQPVKHFREK